MQILLSKDFIKYYRKRIPSGSDLEQRYKDRVAIFVKDRKASVLKNHKLTGKLKGKNAFSITGDIRVVYIEESKNLIVFVDIGSHNQVY